MGLEEFSDLCVVIKIEEDSGLYAVDHMEVNVYAKADQIGSEYTAEPLASMRVVKVHGGHSLIVDSADGVSTAFYLAARALLGQQDSNINDYLARLLRMPAHTIGTVDTLFYVDRVVLAHDASPDQVQLILGSAMKTIAKGMDTEKWLGVAYAKKTVFVEEKIGGELTRKQHYYGTKDKSLMSVYRELGFEVVPTFHNEDNKVLAVSGARLKPVLKKEYKLEAKVTETRRLKV